MLPQACGFFRRATTALLDADIHLADSVIAADAEIDALRADLDLLSFDLLARQQPVATDLRVIVTSMRMSSDLERMGDLARHVAKALSWVAMAASSSPFSTHCGHSPGASSLAIPIAKCSWSSSGSRSGKSRSTLSGPKRTERFSCPVWPSRRIRFAHPRRAKASWIPRALNPPEKSFR